MKGLLAVVRSWSLITLVLITSKVRRVISDIK